MFTLKRTGAPVDLLSLDEIKRHLIIDHSDDDQLLMDFAGAATAYLDGNDGILGRCLVKQTWETRYRAWRKTIDLPFPDVSEISVSFIDLAGSEQSVSNTNFQLVNTGACTSLYFEDTPPAVSGDEVYPIKVTLMAGYGEPEDVPPSIKTAILMLIAQWYDNREATAIKNMSELPYGVSTLLAPHRLINV